MRFKRCPKDFTWQELVTLLEGLGFTELQGKGSRVKFFNEICDCMIFIHKPHPNNVLKSYAIKYIWEILTKKSLI